MTITIDLAPEEEASLRERAIEQGQATEALVTTLVRQNLRPAPSAAIAKRSGTEMTDAEFDAYWGPYIGVIHGSHEPLSENCGEKFTDYLVEKKRQGHL